MHPQNQLLSVLEALDDLDFAMLNNEKALCCLVLLHDQLACRIVLFRRDLIDLMQIVLGNTGKKGDFFQSLNLGKFRNIPQDNDKRAYF